ncbi:MAG: helix-turn-helix domain-containing protein [Clostridia bacterium]|nr:helix-turn-helix domain-containing protein [Clostridia bacterium]
MKAKGYSTIAGLEHASPEEIKRRNLEHYGSKIKRFRVRAGMSAEQLADALGISISSVRNWECGLTRPDPEFLYRMFTLLDVEPNVFFGLRGVGGLLTDGEESLLSSYRALDAAGREDAQALLEAMRAQAWRRQLASASARMSEVADWGRYAAAGDGTDWPDYPEKESMILYDDPLVSRADEIITVTGRSMEPQFQDRDRVLVEHCAALRNGDIGIFYVPGLGGVIKQKAYDRLHSINPEFDDIFPYEEGAAVVGRVLGRVEPHMIPSPQDQALYRAAREAEKG